ncbi:hypothetical protein G7Z17_g5070 [Cylindrodendrum hubeiense]|uniref:Uncharacterized protein n=1 Tax=Cylindrodendrum hubeiense TaxID=595255 RepID=A0A9P5LI90_9HYPO|nr:hypothetical protein G7Z17_g5070 [Cylindrodendrum hubeiense]
MALLALQEYVWTWENASHASSLGKSLELSDISHVLLPQDWDEAIRKEAMDAKRDPSMRLKHCYTMLMRNHIGISAMWPTIDPSTSRHNLRLYMRMHSANTAKKWLELNQLVVAREGEIQQSIVELGESEDSSGIEALLRKAWRTARDDYNKNMAAPPKGVFPGFSLDPHGEIAISHASDLDNFSLDFLDDLGNECGFRRIPLYRNGANYYQPLQPETREYQWPYLPEPPTLITKNISYNVDVRGHTQRVGASYLVPHINLADLTNPLNLLTFIHHRARMKPHEFAQLDNELTYVGRSSRILTGAFAPWRMIQFIDRVFDGRVPNIISMYDGYGDHLIAQNDQPVGSKYRNLYQRGKIFGCMAGWLVMQTQFITYSFLFNLCKDLIAATEVEKVPEKIPETIEERELLRIKVEASVLIEKVKRKANNGVENWHDLASLRQYEPFPTRVNANRYLSTLQSKSDAAEQHLTRLFNEPNYFLEVVLEQKQHHWANLTVDYGDMAGKHINLYNVRNTRYELYCDCIRSVLRRAIFGFFMWSLVETLLVRYDKVVVKQRKALLKEYKGNDPDETSFLTVSTTGDAGKDFEQLVAVVRYSAVLFLKEFSSKLIHASYEPMLPLYSRLSQANDFVTKLPDEKKDPFPFARNLYDAPDRVAKPVRTTLHAKHLDLKQIVADLMNNFIANTTTCLYVGVRKITERLQRYLDDCDDEETSGIFSSLVADTIDSLDVLAEIAQHLEDFSPHSRGPVTSQLVELVTEACEGNSIDLNKFDEFPYEVKSVPNKRIERIYKFLDEAQGFDTQISITIGQARGDLKRLGASLLKRMIVPMNKHTKYQARPERLARLEEIMEVRRDQYEFHAEEKPIDLDIEENIPVRLAFTTWRGVKDELENEAQRRRKERKERDLETQKTFNQPVLDEVRRLELVKLRQAKENDRRRRLQMRRKERWNQRTGAAGPGAEQPEDDGIEAEKVDIQAEAVRRLSVQDQPAPEPAPQPAILPQPPVEPEPQPAVLPPLPAEQQPLPPAPPPREPTPERPHSPPLGIAPDDNPKETLNKRVWKTLSAVYGFDDSRVSWAELVRAMNTLGYREHGRGGSHGVFLRTARCRWPEGALGKGRNIQLAKNHEGGHAGAARGKVKDWGVRLAQRKMTWEFIQKWYQPK